MDRWPLRFSMLAVWMLAICLSCGSLADAKGVIKRASHGGHAHGEQRAHCGDCTPVTCNVCHGCHGFCGCGCAHSGFFHWCGHGKDLGWSMRNGILPKCAHRDWWMCQQYGYGGYGGGFPGGAAHGWGGYYPDLFYNYHAPQTGPEGGLPVGMYPSPHATPPPAIQVYYTYQPWMPHEHLYEHNRSYLRVHSGGLGATQTHVEWGNSPLRRHKY